MYVVIRMDRDAFPADAVIKNTLEECKDAATRDAESRGRTITGEGGEGGKPVAAMYFTTKHHETIEAYVVIKI